MSNKISTDIIAFVGDSECTNVSKTRVVLKSGVDVGGLKLGREEIGEVFWERVPVGICPLHEDGDVCRGLSFEIEFRAKSGPQPGPVAMIELARAVGRLANIHRYGIAGAL